MLAWRNPGRTHILILNVCAPARMARRCHCSPMTELEFTKLWNPFIRGPGPLLEMGPHGAATSPKVSQGFPRLFLGHYQVNIKLVAPVSLKAHILKMRTWKGTRRHTPEMVGTSRQEDPELEDCGATYVSSPR